jgi:hypothetical protein
MTNSSKLLTLLYLLIVTACSFKSTNWHSTDTPEGRQISYTQFKGKEILDIKAIKGDILFLTYKVLAGDGHLLLSLKKGQNTLWQKDFSNQKDTSEVQLPISETGNYKLVIEGQSARNGVLDLHFKTLQPKTVQVKINKNIELFGLMWQLDNGADILNLKDSVVIEGKKTLWADWYQIAARNYNRFKQFNDTPLMKMYRENQTKGFTDDFYVGFLLQVAEVPNAKLNSNTDESEIMRFSSKGNLTEAKQNATVFLEALNQFCNAVNFDNYLAENADYYGEIKREVLKNIPPENFLPTLEYFYQKTFNDYILVPSMNISTSAGFGKNHNNLRTIYNTFGPFSFVSLDKNKMDLGFDYPEKIKGLSVHEFGHSFVNPAIDKLPKDLIESTEYLFKPIKEDMAKVSYPVWTQCLYEHFVRAGEVMIGKKIGIIKDVDKSLQQNIDTKFIYVPFIVKQLEEYDKNRNIYKNYDDFVLKVMQRLKEAYKP